MSNLGIELLCLETEERQQWIKAVVLRRLAPGVVLSQDQLFLGLEHDFAEIQRQAKVFTLESYTGLTLDRLWNMLILGLARAWRHPSEDRPVVERTQFADEFEQTLPERVTNVLNITPISMRGLFDNLRDRPSARNTIVMSEEEFFDKHGCGSGKQIAKDRPDDES